MGSPYQTLTYTPKKLTWNKIGLPKDKLFTNHQLSAAMLVFRKATLHNRKDPWFLSLSESILLIQQRIKGTERTAKVAVSEQVSKEVVPSGHVGFVGFVLPFFGGNLYRCGFKKNMVGFISLKLWFWRYQAKLADWGAGRYGTWRCLIKAPCTCAVQCYLCYLLGWVMILVQILQTN